MSESEDNGTPFEASARRAWEALNALAHALGSAWAAQGATDDPLGAQTSLWWQRLRALAERFVGKEASAADVAAAWRELAGTNPFAALFAAPGANAAPGLPPLGLNREHQLRWQALQAASADYAREFGRYQALLAQAGDGAHAHFAAALAKPGLRIESARALFDLWIDCADAAWTEVALSPAYRTAYGALVNAQARVHDGVQTEIEQLSRLYGVPTRSEVREAHRKIHTLERELRDLRSRLTALEAGALADAASKRTDGAPRPARKSAETKPRSAPAPATGRKPASKAVRRGRKAGR